MTTQEAREVLEANYPDACYEQLQEAVDVAIRSLEAWDEVDYLVNKTYWGFPIGLDYCLDMLTEIMKEVEDAVSD